MKGIGAAARSDNARRIAAAGAALLIAGLITFAARTALAADAPSNWRRVLFLYDYNTRIVMLGATVLGVCLGVVGVFMLLRRRSLMGDVVSHASLPGIAMAFLIMEAVKAGTGKWVPGLLVGALVFGGLGMVSVLALRRWTRIKEDAALAIVLSVFFGAGVVLLSVIQKMPSGNAAGLHHFIYGKAASMVARDVWLILITSALSTLLVLVLFKELRLLCFDEKFARSQGWSTTLLDLVVMGVVVGMSVVGLQSVGLLLVVAMLIIPASAGRFWSDRLDRVVLAAAIMGGASAYLGVVISALAPNIPTGAVIVLSGAGFFTISLFFGSKRGLLRRWWRFRTLQRRTEQHHLLRAAYELLEARAKPNEAPDLEGDFTAASLEPFRAWRQAEIERILRRCERLGWCRRQGADWRLTEAGAEESRRTVRNHRLWEIYLIQYADIAPSHVDRDADDIEHVLGEELVAELQQLLQEQSPGSIPASPHDISEAPSGASR